MRKLIIIILVLLLVGGGGAVGLVMLGVVRNPLKPPPPPKLDAVAQAAADADAKAKENAFKPPLAALTIVKAGDLVVPVLSPGHTDRKVFVTARLVVDTPAKASVQDDIPKLTDALLSDFIPYFQTYFQDHDMLDLVVIKKKIVRHAHEVFGDKVKDVLMVNVFSAGGGTPVKGAPYDPD